MSWAFLIKILLQILPEILKLFETKPALAKKYEKELGQIRSGCQQLTNKITSAGFAAVPLPMNATEDE